MTEQYLRAASLILGSASGDQLDLSALRITFGIQHAVVQTPRAAAIRVYNPAASTVARISAEFTTVTLSAGYQGNIATIFTGTIKQRRAGRESPTDTFLDLFAADGDEAYNQAVVNQSLAAGWTDTDVLNAIVTAMQPFGITMGHVPTLNAGKAPRGMALYGGAKAALRDLAARNGCSWNLDGGHLNLIPLGGTIPGPQAIVLNSSTGMIGIPVQTIDGIEVTTLLNPQIKPGSTVKVNQSDILAAQNPLEYANITGSLLPTIPTDGLYAVQWVDLEGDTRGQPWYSHLVCLAIDPSAQGPRSPAQLENVDA
jgi:hypothetical protein